MTLPMMSVYASDKLVDWRNKLNLVGQWSKKDDEIRTYLERLIESSSPLGSIGKTEGEKASGGGVVFHAWKDGKWLGVVADPALSDRIFIGHIQSHLQEGEKVVCKICGRTAEEITGQAAPSPAPTIKKDLTVEVEEAMEKIITRLEGRGCSEEIDVIKAALRPKVVSRDVVKDIIDSLIDDGPLWYRGSMPEEGKAIDILSEWLRELGIEVGD